MSTLHICTNDKKIPEKLSENDHLSGTVTIYSGGSMIEVSKNRTNLNTLGENSAKRGEIKGFSYGSRRRLMSLIGKLDRSQLPLFVTLTYPKIFPEDPAEWKRHLKNIKRRIKYYFPKVAFIWKLEPQRRGAPHFHLLLWGAERNVFKRFITWHWYQVVGSGDEKHLHAGTQVDYVRSPKGVFFYVSKYMAKVEKFPDGWNFPGRIWGVFNRSFLPMAVKKVYRVFVSQINQAMRLMRRYAGIKSRDYNSLSIFCNDPDQWARALIC